MAVIRKYLRRLSRRSGHFRNGPQGLLGIVESRHKGSLSTCFLFDEDGCYKVTLQLRVAGYCQLIPNVKIVCQLTSALQDGIVHTVHSEFAFDGHSIHAHEHSGVDFGDRVEPVIQQLEVNSSYYLIQYRLQLVVDQIGVPLLQEVQCYGQSEVVEIAQWTKPAQGIGGESPLELVGDVWTALHQNSLRGLLTSVRRGSSWLCWGSRGRREWFLGVGVCFDEADEEGGHIFLEGHHNENGGIVAAPQGDVVVHSGCIDHGGSDGSNVVGLQLGMSLNN